MDQTNFVQGCRNGTRIVPAAGLRVDFNELAADSDTVGLWHLHDGGCLGEGTGLEDASGHGHPLVNHGADPREDGYELVRADGDYLQAALSGQPARPAWTLEAWFRGWNTPVEQWATILVYEKSWSDGWCWLQARRRANPAESRISVSIQAPYKELNWVGAAADAVLGSGEPWHVAVVADAPASFRMFVNGVLRAEGLGNVPTMPSGSHRVWVGHTTLPPGLTADEVRLSSAARSNFPASRLLTSGAYVSPTFDAARVGAVWQNITADQVTPSGTSVTWEARAADGLDALGNPLAEWQPYNGDPSSLPLGRWFQWRATLWSSPARLATPTVESVEAQSGDVGYDLYHAIGPGPEALDYAQPYARAGPHIRSLESGALMPGTVHWFGVRPVDARGVASPTAQGEVRIELDWQGGRVPDRPAGVLALSVRPLPGGIARLDWRWRPGQGGVVPRAFRIFGDGGIGAIDYQTPLGEVAYRDTQPQYAWESGELAGGLEHQLAVRAVAADEVWDEQPAVVRVTPDAEPPSRVDALQAEAIL
jgi:hypothetical protein